MFVACGATAEAPTPPPKVPEIPKQHATVAPDPEEHEAEPVVGIDSSRVRTIVLGNFDAFRGCHTLEYGGGQMVAGKLVLEWEINPDGSVDTAYVSDSSFDNEHLDQCVISVMKNISFPKSSGSTEVSWTFRFQPRSGTQLAKGD